MKELQALVAKAVADRGYRAGWTDEQFAARQICKAVEELAEVGECIKWIYHNPSWIDSLQDIGAQARGYFDDNRAWYQAESFYPEISQEIADVLIPLLCLADVLGIDLEQVIREKALGDAQRGMRGEEL